MSEKLKFSTEKQKIPEKFINEIVSVNENNGLLKNLLVILNTASESSAKAIFEKKK